VANRIQRAGTYAGLVAVLALPLAAMAEQPRVTVRGGAHLLSPKGSNGSILVPGTGKLDIDVDDATSFTFNVTYHVNDRWGVEFLGSTPFTHDIDIETLGAAETSLVPLSLSLVYQFNPRGRFRPYAGFGVHATVFFDEDPEPLALDDEISIAGLVGLDIGLTDRWLLNVDLRWYDLDTEIHLDDVGEVGTVSIDPVAYGVMVGYRFGGSRR